MLSKSQARAFFLGGTAVFSLVFLFLTVDSIRQVPAQTKSENITEEVKRGKAIFDKNNCMGCHTILGEGAYYAPELTKVYIRRDKEWIKMFLKDPQAMYPNERKMVKYNFSDQDISDLTSFFKWISEMDLNGFPPKPDLAESLGTAKTSSNNTPDNKLVLENAPAKFKQICMSCHTLKGSGGSVGPVLDGVGKKFDEAYLQKWLKDPQSVKPLAKMPKLDLSDSDRNEIVSFLAKN